VVATTIASHGRCCPSPNSQGSLPQYTLLLTDYQTYHGLCTACNNNHVRT
jgi:hypothetical protein